MRKGQLFSMDFLSAVFVFLLVFGILLLYWGSFLDDIAIYGERKDMELYSNRIADFLVNGRGMPNNWHEDPDNVITFGIMDFDREIDEVKLNALLAMDYDKLRKKLMISGYNICIRLVYAGLEKCDFGTGDDLVAYTGRGVSYKGKNDVIEVFVWRYL